MSSLHPCPDAHWQASMRTLRRAFAPPGLAQGGRWPSPRGAWRSCAPPGRPHHRRRAKIVAGACCSSSHHHHHHHHHEADGQLAKAGSGGQGSPWSLKVLLVAILGRTGIRSVTHRLEHSAVASSVAVVGLLVATAATLTVGGTRPEPPLALWAARLGRALVFALCGVPLLVESLLLVAGGMLETHVLMCLAVLGSLYLGLPQEGALLLVLFHVSHMLEDKLTEQAGSSLESLLRSMPDKATLMDKSELGSFQEADVVKADEVPVGSYILIRPGEQVPLDGMVVEGRASVMMDHISGESLPVRIQEGDEIAAGSRNTDGILVVQTTQRAQDSTPAKIAQLAVEAQASKPKIQLWTDSLIAVWSKGALIATGMVLGTCLALGIPFLGERGALYRALGVCTAAAPCAIVLVPLAYICALANATRRRILIKRSTVLDSLLKCRTVGLDKTGTLTTGCLTCTAVLPQHHSKQRSEGPGLHLQTATQLRALSCAVSLSQWSLHPISQAVTMVGNSLNGRLPVVELVDFKMVPGFGVQGGMKVEGGDLHPVVFGSVEFAEQVLPQAQLAKVQGVVSEAGKDEIVAVLVEGEGVRATWTVFCFEDALQRHSNNAVRLLQRGSWRKGRDDGRWKQRVVMLTGDSQVSGAKVAAKLGIEEVYAALKPHQKLAFIKEMSNGGRRGGTLMMVGDGMNDAPALSAADIGVAISTTANDASALASDVVVLNGQGVNNLPFLLKLAHDTRGVVIQNLFLAFGSMVVAVAPTVAGVLPLWVAVFVHEGTTLLTAVSALRLLFTQPPRIRARQ